MRHPIQASSYLGIFLLLSWMGIAAAETSAIPSPPKKAALPSKTSVKKTYHGAAIKVKVVKPRAGRSKGADVDAQVKKTEESMESHPKMTADQLRLQEAEEKENKKISTLSKASKKRHETSRNAVQNMK